MNYALLRIMYYDPDHGWQEAEYEEPVLSPVQPPRRPLAREENED